MTNKTLNNNARKHDFEVLYKNIEAKTQLSPKDFQKLAADKGLLQKGTKPKIIIDWLKDEFALGHGHAMAIYYTIKPLIQK